MPKKKSVKKAAQSFLEAVQATRAYLNRQEGTADEAWAHEYAILRLYRDFERLMLHALIGAVNNDTTTLSKQAGIQFPRHLTDEVCEYLIVGDGYFDFRGRDGLIRTVREFVPDGHYLLAIVKDTKYKVSLERLSALRNYAAHDSAKSKERAREAVSQAKITTAGEWLSTQQRFFAIASACEDLAKAIKSGAPY